jgi:hypothetical protein
MDGALGGIPLIFREEAFHILFRDLKKRFEGSRNFDRANHQQASSDVGIESRIILPDYRPEENRIHAKRTACRNFREAFKKKAVPAEARTAFQT